MWTKRDKATKTVRYRSPRRIERFLKIMTTGADPSDMSPPPLSTRSATRKIAFFRVLKTVLEIPDDDLLFKVLDYNGIPESMLDLISIPENKLETWSWNDGNVDHYLTPHRIIQMNILKAWSIQLRSVQGKRMVDWLDEHSVNGDTWDEFRIGDHGNPNASISSFLPLSPYSSSDTRSEQRQPRPPVSAAAEFRKGIKRDKSHYKEIRNEKQWDDWKRSTISTVYAHWTLLRIVRSFDSSALKSAAFIASEVVRAGHLIRRLAAFFVLGEAAFSFLAMLGTCVYVWYAKSEWMNSMKRAWDRTTSIFGSKKEASVLPSPGCIEPAIGQIQAILPPLESLESVLSFEFNCRYV